MGMLERMARKITRSARPVLVRFTATGELRWHRAKISPAPIAVYSIYRARNANHLTRLIASAPAGSEFHLHALDEISAELTEHTSSSGAGARMPLLNALIDQHPPSHGLDVMILDDDVEFIGHAASAFVGIARAAQLDIAQPAHAIGSPSSFRANQVDSPSTVRLVRFVESGPVVMLSRETFDRLYPFPADLQMGWGIDVWWSALLQPALRLGVVDATPVVHLGEVGAEYANDTETAILASYLERAGIQSAHELDSNVGLTWRPWQAHPKWL